MKYVNLQNRLIAESLYDVDIGFTIASYDDIH